MNVKVIKGKNSKYIKAIDGLRAFAVISVIINHFNNDILGSGFLGVDIFFVISGFVITSSLTNLKEKNFLNFILSFYFRRIKRLIPALLFFIVPTTILICFFNSEPKLSLSTAKTALFGFSNIYLFSKATDYFGQSAAMNPFTHTWSLGIEEQFYFLFPLIIWFTGYSRNLKNGIRNLFLCISFIFIISLLCFYYFYSRNPSAAYFLISSRAWEMAAGCLAFLIYKKFNKNKNSRIKIPSNFSLIIIISTLFAPKEYSFITTLLCVFITCNLLTDLDNNFNKNKFLNHEIMVLIGKMSYSLYLWHWGIISLSKWTIGNSLKTFPILLGLIILLSSVSYFYVEKPFRKKLNSGKFNLLFASFSLLGIFFALINLIQKEFYEVLFLGNRNSKSLTKEGEISYNKYKQLIYKESKLTNEQTCNPCHWTCGKINNQIIEKCGSSYSSNKNTLWIFGDSHSASLQPAGAYLAEKLDYSLFIFGKPGTLFPPNIFKIHEKYDLSEGIVDSLRSEQKVAFRYFTDNFKNNDIVIITQRYPLYFGPDFSHSYDTNTKYMKYYDHNKNKISRERFYNLWLVEIEKFVSFADSKSINVLITNPLPEFPTIYNRANFSNCGNNWYNLPFNKCSPEKNDINYSKDFYYNQKGIYKKFDRDLKLLESRFSNLKVVNLFDSLCKNNSCYYSIDNNDLYTDHNHISKISSWNYVGPTIMNYIKSF